MRPCADSAREKEEAGGVYLVLSVEVRCHVGLFNFSGIFIIFWRVTTCACDLSRTSVTVCYTQYLSHKVLTTSQLSNVVITNAIKFSTIAPRVLQYSGVRGT